MKILGKSVGNAFCIGLLMLYCFLSIPLFSGVNVPVYEQLRQHRFSSQSIAVPAAGITFKRENAVWVLESGAIRMMKPTADGRVTGLVFEGKGRFKMTIPHWVEKEQLRRCSRRPDYNDVDEMFDKLVIRSPEAFLKDLIALPEASSYKPNGLAADRHKVWLKLGKEDVDARVTAALYNPGDEYLRVEMKTAGFGWLTYIFDKYLIEECEKGVSQKAKHMTVRLKPCMSWERIPC